MLTVQPFTFNPVQENTYVVYNEKGACCIIDPGCYFASEEQALQNFIQQNKLQPILLLNTHCHLDHIFGNSFVAKTWGLTLHLNKLEKPVLEYGPASGQLWQLPFVNYSGELNFIDEGDVIRVGESYYLCVQGVWFVSPSPSGPWEVATSVPAEIYEIPPSSPAMTPMACDRGAMI